jgi:ABC-2 type transport system ATP-binding protein
MQRRLSIALAMIHQPEVLILDEPAAGLDPQSRVMVRQRIRALGREQGRTILFSTHDMEEADRVSDRVAIIDHGRLLALDTAAALKQRRGAANLVEIALGTTPPARREEARAALAEISGGRVRRAGEALVIDTDRGAELNRPIRTVLARLGVVPDEIRFRQRSLEDVFLELTGRRLRE